MTIYMDYAATTPVDPRVAACMAECLTADGTFGNPGSAEHQFGAAAAARVEAARAQVAHAVGALAEEVIWTSGATEANNLALFGAAQYFREHGRHIVTVRTEHKAVLDPCRELERRGWRVTYLVPGRDGSVEPAAVAAALQPDTVLISVMLVNNEIGVIQDIAGIAAIRAKHERVRLHVDAAQAVGKVPVDFTALGVDLMSLSAHKVYGPKGAGALLVSRRRGMHIQAQQFGGGQEHGLRSGTVATHQVVGMGAALALDDTAAERARLGALRERLWRGLAGLGGMLRNSQPERSVAQILNVSVEGVEGESLVAAVAPHLAISTGAACSSTTREPSYVLRALGREPGLAESSLRLSFGRFTRETEIDRALEVIAHAVRRLRLLAGA